MTQSELVTLAERLISKLEAKALPVEQAISGLAELPEDEEVKRRISREKSRLLAIRKQIVSIQSLITDIRYTMKGKDSSAANWRTVVERIHKNRQQEGRLPELLRLATQKQYREWVSIPATFEDGPDFVILNADTVATGEVNKHAE